MTEQSELAPAQFPRRPVPAVTISALVTTPPTPAASGAMSLEEAQLFPLLDQRSGLRARPETCRRAIDALMPYIAMWQRDLELLPGELAEAQQRSNALDAEEQAAHAAVAALSRLIAPEVILPTGVALSRTPEFKRLQEARRAALDARARTNELAYLPGQLQRGLGDLSRRVAELEACIAAQANVVP